jgi:hypothetical protein
MRDNIRTQELLEDRIRMAFSQELPQALGQQALVRLGDARTDRG